MERGAALAAVTAGLALGLAPVAELVGSDRGDTDFADESLEFLQDEGHRYGLAGFLLVVAGVALVVVVVGFARTLRTNGDPGLAAEVVTVLGLMSGFGYVFAGVLRHTSHGTIDYIEGTDHDWAESAYYATHMVGTQGLLPLSSHLLAAWLVLVAVIAFRRGLRGLVAVGVLPAFLLALFVLDAIVPIADEGVLSGVVWVVYIIVQLLAQPLALIGFGLVALRSAVKERLAAPLSR